MGKNIMNFLKKLIEMDKRKIFYLKEKISLLTILSIVYAIPVLVILNVVLSKYNLNSKIGFPYNLLLVLIIFCIAISLAYTSISKIDNFRQKHKIPYFDRFTFERYESLFLKADNFKKGLTLFFGGFIILLTLIISVKFIKILFLAKLWVPYYIIITIDIVLLLPLLALIQNFVFDLILLKKK